MRQPSDTDFFVVLPFGTFRIARRTYADRMKIRSEYLKRVRELGDTDEDLSGMAQVAAEHAVLCVEAPSGWESIDKLDLVAYPEREDQAFDLYLALKDKERSFRPRTDATGEASGAGAQPEHGVLVPPAVQPESAGPAVPGADAGAN